MIKAIVFDCFGVVITDALQVMVDELAEKDPGVPERIHQLIYRSNRGHISIEETNVKVAEVLGMPTEEYLRRKSIGETRDQPLLDYIRKLREDYKTGMLSNVSNGGLLRRFKVAELDEYFDVSIASGEIGFAKPEAEAYEIIADRLGVRLDECVFTDDREPYCEGARAVGMKAILYENFTQFKADLETLLSTNN